MHSPKSFFCILMSIFKKMGHLYLKYIVFLFIRIYWNYDKFYFIIQIIKYNYA